MSQLVACATAHCVILASDRCVVLLGHGEERCHSVRKLYPLGDSAAVATSGAAVGIGLSRAISRALIPRASPALAEVEAYAMSVFQREYAAFVHQGSRWFARHPEAHRSSYVLIAGRDRAGGFRFSFYASETHDQPYRRLRTTAALTAPRRLGLEVRLARAAAEEAGPEPIVEVIVEGLRAIARQDDSVAGPFDVAVIDAAGLRLLTY